MLAKIGAIQHSSADDHHKVNHSKIISHTFQKSQKISTVSLASDSYEMPPLWLRNFAGFKLANGTARLLQQ